MVCLSKYNPTTSDISDTTLHYVVKDLQRRNLFESIPLEFDDSPEYWKKPSFDDKNSTTFKINRNSDEFIELCRQSLESSTIKKNLPTRSELLKRMTDGLPINTKNSSDFDSYTKADIKKLILNENIKKLKSISSQWANVVVKSLGYQTPLLWASHFGHADIVKILIDSGANVNVVDSDNQTPLHEASQDGYADVVKILINSGENVNVLDSFFNETPLHEASQDGYVDIVKILIDSGANVNVVDKYNRTPLHKASHYGHADVVKILKHNGAVVDSNENACVVM